MKSAQHWYSGGAGSENGTKEWVCFRVSVWRLWTPLERLLRDDQGAKVLPTHRGMGLGEIPPAVSLAWLEDALEKLRFTLLAVTVSKESFCSSLVLGSGHGQWNKF